MSATNANTFKPFEVVQNTLNKAAKSVIEGVTAKSAFEAVADTTHIDDVNPFQTKAFCDLLQPKPDTEFNPKLRAIMSEYFGELKPEDETTAAALIAYFDGDKEEYLNAQARIQYRALDALRRKLKTIVEKVPQGSRQHVMVQQFIASHIEAAKEYLEPFEEGSSLALTAGSTTLAVIIIAWLQFIAVNRRDTSFQPLRIPSNNRSISVFIGMIYSRTANWKTLADMFVQRIIVPAPTQILYTVAIFEEAFYGTPTYKGINLGSSVALVLGVMGLQELQEDREKKQREKVARLLTEAANDAEAGNLHQIAKELGIEVDDLKKLLKMLVSLRAEFKVDHNTGSTFARMMGVFTQLTAGLTTVFGDHPEVSEQDNPDLMEKIGVTTLGGILAVIVTASTSDNDAALGINLTWAIYFLYRLIKSTHDKEHGIAQTMHILSQAGINVIFNIFFHSIPLFALGADAFDDHRLQTAMTVILSVLTGTIAHKTGPFLVPYLMPAVRGVFNMIRRLRAKFPTLAQKQVDEGRKVSPEPAKVDAFMLLMTARQSDEDKVVTLEGNFLEPEGRDNLFDLFLRGLDVLEKTDRGNIRDGGVLPSTKFNTFDPDAPANITDMLSAIDIAQDVNQLSGSSSLDRYKAFDLWISRLVQSDDLHKLLRQMARIGCSM